MRHEVSFRDELGQHRLLQQLPFAIQLGAGGRETFRERLRCNQITDPQPREQRLAEAADIDHLPGRIETLQRRERPAAVAEFAVVVVLDDPAAVLARVFEQHPPPREAHHHPERILVRRRDQHQLRRLGEIGGRWRDPFVVDRDRPRRQPRHVQHAAHAPVARILGPDCIARVGQQPHREVDRLVDAGRDHDLLRRAAHRARRAQVVGQRLAQQRGPPPGA